MKQTMRRLIQPLKEFPEQIELYYGSVASSIMVWFIATTVLVMLGVGLITPLIPQVHSVWLVQAFLTFFASAWVAKQYLLLFGCLLMWVYQVYGVIQAIYFGALVAHAEKPRHVAWWYLWSRTWAVGLMVFFPCLALMVVASLARVGGFIAAFVGIAMMLYLSAAQILARFAPAKVLYQQRLATGPVVIALLITSLLLTISLEGVLYLVYGLHAMTLWGIGALSLYNVLLYIMILTMSTCSAFCAMLWAESIGRRVVTNR